MMKQYGQVIDDNWRKEFSEYTKWITQEKTLFIISFALRDNNLGFLPTKQKDYESTV